MAKLFKSYYLIFCVFSFINTGCQKQDKIFEGIAMTMHYKVILGEPINKQKTLVIEAGIRRIFQEIDSVFNNWNSNSEISRFNKSQAFQEISVSSHFIEFLAYVNKLHLVTDGRFDPTLNPIKKLWLAHLQRQSFPSNEDIAHTKKGIGWEKIIISRKNHTLTKKHSQTELDLCGVVKGHAVDLISLFLKKKNINNFYVEWGGEIKLSGQHPSGRLWKIGLVNPKKVLSITNQAIASSGNYIQKWRVRDHYYTHIINPRTCEPLQIDTHFISSVTVFHLSCSYADALATALMTFESKDEALLWTRKHNIRAFIE